MIVLSIATDRKIFEERSAVRFRMIEYGKIFKELHIVVFTLKDSDYKPIKISDNVWVYPTNSKNRFYYPFSANRFVKNNLANLKPDVVTAQDPFETGLAAWLIAKRLKIPLHLQIHTDFASIYFKKGSFLNRVRVILARFLLPKAKGVRAVSERIKKSLGSIDKTLPQRTIVLPISTDLEKFIHSPKTPDLHAMYPQFPFIVLTASRLTAEKNIGYAIKVMRDVIVRYPETGFVIVGDGPEKKYLQGLTLKYNINRNIIFLPWHSDLAPFYKTADVFLSTSLYEGYGLTLVEASASGCPIISSDVGVVSEIVENGKTGFICDLSNRQQFTESIIKLLSNPSLGYDMRAQLQQVNTKRIIDSKESYLKKYQNMLEILVPNNNLK